MVECKITEKLVELRMVKDITQEEVANALSALDVTMLVKLSEYYNVSTDTLLGIAQ